MTSLTTTDHTEPERRVLHLLLSGRSLRFPDDLEMPFREQFNAAAARSTRSSAIMVLLLIALFASFDRYALPLSYREAWALRPGLQVAPALLLALCSGLPWVVRHIQGLMTTSLLLGALGTLLIIGLAQPGEWAYFLYPYALAHVVALGYNGVRLRHPFAMTVGLSATAGYVLTALLAQHILDQPGGAVAFVLPLFFLIAINVIGMLSCRNTERLLRQAFLQKRLIEHEQARAEALLSNALPVPIVERLKRQEVVADAVEEAGVLFADLTRFTEMAARIPAARVVALLDVLFTRFDALAEKHGVEKIKTIGDAYMAASGVPVARTGHLRDLARMALDMRAEVAILRQLEPGMDVRIGIAAGPVVAGVIGSKRRLYDLWGDTVNLASRLESQGLPGRIQVDDRTRTQLEDEFELEARGSITLKGRGECVTYWLNAARVGAS